jgi:hypothetical protein
MKESILYYGYAESKVHLDVVTHDMNRRLKLFYRICSNDNKRCLDISGYNLWTSYKQGDAVSWWDKKTKSLTTGILNQLWLLQPINDDEYYIKNCNNDLYLCYGENNRMFLSNNESDKKIIIKHNKNNT